MNNYQEQFKLGLISDPTDERDIIFKATAKIEDLPDEIDLRNSMPPIWNQGNFSSCSAFAILRILSYYVKNTFVPSPMFQYNNTLKYEGNWGLDQGCSLRGAIKALNNNGVCTEELCKYIKANFGVEPSEKAVQDALERIKNLKFKYYRVSNSEEIYQAMALGYVPYIGINITDSFYTDACIKQGIIPSPEGLNHGGHALPITYGSLKQKLYVVDNSWTEDAGNKGRFSCTFENLDRLLIDAWALDIDGVI